MASSDWQYTAHMPDNFLRGREQDAGILIAQMHGHSLSEGIIGVCVVGKYS